MKLTKTQRADIREKFGGRCAYCGCELPERWHADHFDPVVRNWGEYAKVKPAMKPENHHIENMMPRARHAISASTLCRWKTGVGGWLGMSTA